jgi:hypothetical protein
VVRQLLAALLVGHMILLPASTDIAGLWDIE